VALVRDALSTPDLRRLQMAWAAAAVGGWAFMVALAVHAYEVGGAPAVGFAALVRMVPAGLAAPLLGAAADRFSRRDVLLAATVVRAVLLGVAALAPFALLLVLTALVTVAGAAHKPAQAALLPRLAPDLNRQAAANAVATAVDNVAFVVGALAAGAVVAAAGAPAVFAVAAAAFAVAAALIARIGRDRPHPNLKGPRRFAFGLVVRDRRLRLLVGVLSASTLIEGMVDVLVVVVALRLVDLGGAGVGWLNAAWGAGGIVGGALALRLVARGRLARALPAGGLLIGLPLLALAALPEAGAALALLAILGVGYSLVEVAGVTLLQRLAHDRVRARAAGVLESSYWLTTGAGAMLAPAVVALAGPRGALLVMGAALPLIILSRWAALTGLARTAPALAATAARRVAA
jgi:MFS family permease